MTCDDVFDFLTSDTRDSREDVAAHMQRCPRCRDLADMLQPLRGSFDFASPSPAATLDLARSPASEAVEIAHSAARRLQAAAESTRPASRRRGPTFYGHVAAFLAGAAASLCLAAGSSQFQASPMPGSAQPICKWGRDLLENSNWQVAANSCQRCHMEQQSPEEKSSVDEDLRLSDAWENFLVDAVPQINRADSGLLPHSPNGNSLLLDV